MPRRLREFLWPQMGWKRASLYVGHRLARLPGTPYSIAAGFACGAAISFTPFVGFHFVLSALLAWALRANILASAIGTVVGNPWTFPFIWVWIYETGSLILRTEPTPLQDIELSFHYLVEHALDIFLPMLIGSIPTATVVWFAFFWPTRYLVALYQRKRLERRTRRNETPKVSGGIEEAK
jgi:uncharacterized protein (DUF2062 family)